MPVAREEIFGPVQSVLEFDSLEQAVGIANDTEYGLSAGVFTRDVATAHRVAAQLQAGQVQVNRYAGAGVEMPFGGYKNSGLGREKGIDAVHHYTQVKASSWTSHERRRPADRQSARHERARREGAVSAPE